jgi:aspartate ammonia-lyase
MTTHTRTETDLLGDLEIPASALYGIHTVRGVQNLTVSSRQIGQERALVMAFAHAKKAAAYANRDLAQITAAQCDAIAQACDEVERGQHDHEFIVDMMEGSGGTSTNMNFNEVIACRAMQIAGGDVHVHPNDHVNRSQSTNDVVPSAMKMAAYTLLAPLVHELDSLALAFEQHSESFARVLHLGRTCMQDAQPMTLGQVFGGYAALTHRLAHALGAAREALRVLPLGGTAIGTGFGAPAGYRAALYPHLCRVTGVNYEPAADSFDAMQNLDTFLRVSGELRTAATSLGKVASDLILLSSGPHGGLAEIALPAVQAGSSIMPGKVNPVVPMSMVQLAFAVQGNDVAIAQANQAGQLEINHFEPLVADRLFDSIRLLTNGVRLLRTRCIEGLTARVDNNERHLLASSALATALIPRLGYEATSRLVKESDAAGVPLLEMLARQGLMTHDQALAALADAARAQA